MTYHSSMSWEFGDPITQEVIDEVVKGLEYNIGWNKNNSNKKGYETIYWLGGDKVDFIIYNTGLLLDRYFGYVCNPPMTNLNELVKRFCVGAPPGMEKAMKEIALKVIKRKGGENK